jgi:hypothetical protein
MAKRQPGGSKGDPATKLIPVIALTAKLENESKDERPYDHAYLVGCRQ